MKLKRLLAVVTSAALMMTALAGCSGGGSGESANNTEGEKIKIGISKMMTHAAMDEAEKGFVQALKDKGYDDSKVEIDYQNGQGEPANLNTIATQFVGNDVDLIFAIATPAAQAAQSQTTEIPIIGTAITDFADAGLVNSNENPGTNVSGTTDMNPVEDQIDLLIKLVPNVKTIGLLYNTSEDNSILQTNIAKKYIESKGLKWVEKTVSNTNEVQQATTAVVSECEAIYIPTDNIFASSMTTVGEICNEKKIPVICGESGMAKAGGLATLGLDYYKLGYQAGEMAVQVLEGGDISAMPIQSASEFVYYINADTVEALGIQIPAELQQYVAKPTAE